jgi:hypothetical protein
MKKRTILALALVLVTSSVVLAASVTPVLVDPWKSGDAYFECEQAGSTADYAYKFDDWDGTTPLTGEEAGNTITISNADMYTFDWASEWPVDVVIVKAGTGALLYWYYGAYSDTYLWAPYDKEISHATFCFNEPEMCYEEETAWAEGDRYVQRGNWAMYVDYYGEEKTVEIIADYTNYVHIGTATFSAPDEYGMVTITINLTGGAIFYYDVNDPYYDDNLKIQDYDKAPTKTPRPGRFAWKWQISTGATTATVTVPLNNFYGVHMDVALPVPCQ